MSAGVERAAAQAVAAAAGRLADRMREVPGVSVARDGGRVTVSGRGLAARLLEEPALRWPGGLP